MGRRLFRPLTNISRCLVAFLAVPGLAMLAAPAGLAAPKCINTSPHTTQCQTNGSTAIVTSPPAMSYGPWYGGVFGFGGGGGIGLGW